MDRMPSFVSFDEFLKCRVDADRLRLFMPAVGEKRVSCHQDDHSQAHTCDNNQISNYLTRLFLLACTL